MANFNSQKRKNSMRRSSGAPAPEVTRVKLPNRSEGEQLGIVMQLMGTDQVKSLCEDGEERQLRIPGKLRKRVWIRENDVIIVKLWDFQPSKGDIVWRYLGHQVEWLKRNGYMKKFPI